MKQLLLLLFGITSFIGFSQCADSDITNFECGQPKQTVAGNGITLIANPVARGINNSANVGEYTDDGTNAWDNLQIDYGSAIDLSTNNQLRLKLYSPTSIQILAKLEGGGSTNDEIWSSFSAVNTWEEFTFDFSSSVANGHTRLVLFVNVAVTSGTATDIYYLDDLQWAPLNCTNPSISNFECVNPSQTFPSTLRTVSNPYYTGINTSTNVGEYTDDGIQGFDALVIDYGTAIDLSINNQLKFKLYSPTSIQVLAKIEGGTPQEIWSSFSGTNTWEEFTFDFSASSGAGNTTLVLFFNAGVSSGTASDIYYIDDLGWEASPTSCVDPLITDFECDIPSHPLTGNISTIPNPVSGGINTSANVGEYTDDGTQGFDALVIDYGTAIDLSTTNQLKFKFYSPTSIQVLAKVEDGTPQEVWSSFSGINTWEEFTFDFSASASAGNTTLVLFFNAAATTGTPTDIYYIDDVRWETTLSIDNANFEEGLSVYPNPTSDIININSRLSVDSYNLYDMLGKSILNRDNINSETFDIDISALKIGIYFLRMTSGSTTKTVKVLKQ